VAQTTSQQLAEAYKNNLEGSKESPKIPEYFHEFEDIGAKESFDILPEWKIHMGPCN
jgi:hypothetical protein